MLPEIGASELLVIAVIALIVVGPKDLPAMLRKLGQFIARMRSMAAEFRTSFDEMARQSELEDLRREVEAMRAGRYLDPVRQAVEDIGDPETDRVFDEIDADLRGVKAEPQPEALPQPEPEPKPKTPRKTTTAKKAPAKKAAPKKAAPKPRKKKTPPEAPA